MPFSDEKGTRWHGLKAGPGLAMTATERKDRKRCRAGDHPVYPKRHGVCI